MTHIIIGFKSGALRETVSEGWCSLVFVKNRRVVCSICGHADALGHSVWLPPGDGPFGKLIA